MRTKCRGCGTAGRAVASDTRDPQVESQQRQNILIAYYAKEENKEKEALKVSFKWKLWKRNSQAKTHQ